jgi:hypothetical protein
MSILPNFVFADMRVTAWSRQSHGQVEAWTLRAIQRWQHPLQPNNNWHRARPHELTLECVWKQGGTDKDRQDNDGQAQETGRPRNRAASAIPSSARIWRRGHPSRLPYGSLRSALTGPDRRRGKKLGGGNGREPERQVRLADGNILPNILDF